MTHLVDKFLLPPKECSGIDNLITPEIQENQNEFTRLFTEVISQSFLANLPQDIIREVCNWFDLPDPMSLLAISNTSQRLRLHVVELLKKDGLSRKLFLRTIVEHNLWKDALVTLSKIQWKNEDTTALPKTITSRDFFGVRSLVRRSMGLPNLVSNAAKHKSAKPNKVAKKIATFQKSFRAFFSLQK